MYFKLGSQFKLCLAGFVVVLSTIALGKPLSVPQPEADEFHFVVLGDSQFHHPALFNRIIDQTRRLRPAFVIQVGDLIEGYNSDANTVEKEWQRFTRQIAPLGIVPFIPIAGNHDIFGGNKKPSAELEAMFEEQWGPLYFSFNYKNTQIIGLNSDSTEGVNQITGTQLKWLQRVLSENQSTHKFVFMHRPPALMKNADHLHMLFKTHNVAQVFYGHHHHYHFFERDGVAYTMTNAAATTGHESEAVGGFPHLLQVSVRGEEVDVAVIKADAIKPQDIVHPGDNYDMFALSRNLVDRRVTLTEKGDLRYQFHIAFHNTSDRDIEVFVECDSDDQRWHYTPKAIAPITMSAGKQHRLKLEASYEPNRVPESSPQCHVRVPFQTQQGQWIDFTQQVQGLIK